MFIKKVIAQNFVSYRELQMKEDLHPGCNLILGYNGQGKSNFLQGKIIIRKINFITAIIFALSDIQSKKTKQERALMLNNRAENREYSVEVTLDNSRQKIPVAGDEIVVKKIYNCDTDKDVYLLNGSHINERELFNLFESGGFSLSGQSQFQIVQQGQVEQLVLQGEEGFLKMLKEVTGTESFDNRVEKMNTVLSDCKTKKDQLEKILSSIKERLDQLGKEIEEYREIQKIEKEKKGLELSIHTHKTQLNLREIEKLRQQKSVMMEERQELINRQQDFLIENSNQKESIDSLKSQIQLLEAKIENLQQMRNEFLNTMVDQENSAKQRKDQKTLFDYFTNSYDQQLKQLSQGVQMINQEIQSLQGKNQDLESEIEKIKHKQSELMREKEILLIKRETIEKFQNPQQRKKFFQDESNKIQVQIASVVKDKDDLTKNLEQSQKKAQDMTSRIAQEQKDEETITHKIKNQSQDLHVFHDEKRKVASQLKSLIFQKNEYDMEIKALKTKYQGEVEALEKLDPIFSTLKRLRAQIKEKQVKGFKGFLIDFLDCEDLRFSACIDLAAKSKLFSIIVDDLEAAREILAINDQIKGGVINIFPLSIMENTPVKPRDYPQSDEVRPLTNQVRLTNNADPRLERLILSIFGKVVLVRNYALGMQIAKDYNLTCVTPDLQIIYAGAFITRVGQYNKSQNDRVSLYRKVSIIQNQVEQKMAGIVQIDVEIDKQRNNDIEAMRKIAKSDVSLNNLKSSLTQKKTAIQDYQQQTERSKQGGQEYQKQIGYLNYQEQQLRDQLKDLEKESQSQAKQFSEQESNRLVFLNKTLDDLSRQLQDKEAERNQLSTQLYHAKSLLNENYLKKQNDLQQQILEQEIDVKMGEGRKSLDNSQSDHKATERDVDKVERELQSLKSQHESRINELQNLLQTIEVQGDNEILHNDLRDKAMKISEVSMKIDELQASNQQLDIAIKKIDVNFDRDTFEHALKEFDEKKVRYEINLKGIELEKFPRMNRHCVEWFDKYSAKHQELIRKFEDQLETEQGMIKLLSDLDSQKQQALEKNFIRLNENFLEIFSRIVPNGRAEMKLVKRDQGDESQISHPSQFNEPSQVMKIGQQMYKGIKVRVSFSGQNNQLEGLAHLSGGQKAVVAASLLFAILKIEAAPFYIMDEFDNALDAEFRGAIADLIFELSKQSQFLITTFKPELIEGADRLYQVKTKNNASEIRQIDVKKANEIINKKDQ